MTTKTWTKEEIRAKLEQDDAWVAAAVVAIFRRQTSDEQTTEDTRYLNHVGFNGVDAGILSSFAKQILQWRATPAVERKYPKPLSQKQLSIARTKIRKYCGQLAQIANAEQVA